MKIRTLLFAVVAVLAASSAQAQQRRITGRVASLDGGAPLSSASVSISGTTIGTFTNESGQFSVLAPPTTVTLRVRRIGYQQRSLVVPAGQNDVVVSLVRDVLELEAQVVTGTTTSVSSLNAANAVTVVGAEALTRVSASTIDNALAGKIAGATITQNSGAPGGGGQVQLRGISSINATYSPAVRRRRRDRQQLDDPERRERHLRLGSRQLLVVSGQVGEPHRRPQPERHREHPGAQGRIRLLDLWIQGHERRHHHHDQAGLSRRRERRFHAACRSIDAVEQPRRAMLRLRRGVR